MRHVVEQFDVYTFDELDERAKDNAREWFRQCLDGNDWLAKEWHDSLKAFVNHFNGKLRDWSYPERGRSYVKVDWNHDDCILDLSGVRLWKYLDANYGGKITVPSGDGFIKKRLDGHDWILDAAAGGCPFTGCCTDGALFDPLAEFVKRPDHSGTYKDRTFRELLYECLESFLSAAADAYEYAYTDEYADESIRANEYEFTENGERY